MSVSTADLRFPADGLPIEQAQAVASGARHGWRNLIAAVLLIAATFIAYRPCWNGAWLWDDDIHLVDNPVLKPGGLATIWIPGRYINYWPLTFTAYWLAFQAWKLDPLGYHLLNIALHVLAALLVWRVLERLKFRGAFFGAAIFALHPVSVEAVAWVAQTKTELSAVLALISLWCYLAYDRRGGPARYAAALAAFILSALAKGDALTLPIIFLALAWWQRGRITLRDLARSLPYFLIAAGMSALEIWSQHLGGSETVRNDGLISRVAIAGRAVWFYLGKLIWPIDLMPIYPRWMLPARGVWAFVPSVLLLAVLGCAWYWRRSWGRPIVMLIVCYVALLAPALGLVNITYMKYSLVADHWQYLAMIVPCAAFAAFAARLARRFRVEWMLLVGGGGLLIVLAYLSNQQSRLYAGPIAYYEAAIARNPECWIAEHNLGLTFKLRGDPTSAELHYRRALRINPDSWLAEGSLGVVLAERGDAAAALAHYQRALALNPDDAETHNNLGKALLDAKKFDAAAIHLKRALELEPTMLMANYNLALALAHVGQLDAAISHLQKELEINPGHELAHKVLDALSTHRTHIVDGLSEIRDRLRKIPDDPALLDQAAWILATSPYETLRDGAEAVELAERARKITGGDDPQNLATVAAAYAEIGKFPTAAEAAENAIRLAQLAGDKSLAGQITACLAFYQAGKPFRDMR